MTNAIAIDEVVRRTGLTSRALRFYEARGLVRPLRTASGRRLFGPNELERVHQIITLKKAGLSLLQIGRLLDQRSIDLAALLRSQLEHLSGQLREIESAQATIHTALSRIENGELLDVATLCSLIKDGDKFMSENEKWKQVINQYWSPQAQAEWAEKMQPLWQANPDWDQACYQQQWRDLSNRIEAALPLNPASAQARDFLREWFKLLEPFSQVASEKMWNATRDMYADMDNWPVDADAGFSKTVWDFIREAQAAAASAGFDYGFKPGWMDGRQTKS